MFELYEDNAGTLHMYRITHDGAATEDEAWDMWRDEALTDEGDVLHLDTGMYHV